MLRLYHGSNVEVQTPQPNIPETVFSMLEDELAGREIEFPEEAF